MIQARGIHQDNAIVLEITQPDHSTPEYRTLYAPTHSEREQKAWDLVYKLNRARVLQVLCKWLKQRKFQLQDSGENARADKASALLMLMNFYSEYHYLALCKIVANNRASFEYVAPGSKSKFLNHYENNIVPILNECCTMKDEIKK